MHVVVGGTQAVGWRPVGGRQQVWLFVEAAADVMPFCVGAAPPPHLYSFPFVSGTWQ